MQPRALIKALREGRAVSGQDLAHFARGLADGSVSDAQGGAFAMAVCLNGLGAQGRVALTQAMRDSGTVLHWDLPGPVVDKHSTGGVGDCVSLVLAPALAACGVYVPMISGRGLGHTGGTLDKMEAIPGLSTVVDLARLRAITAQTGCAIVSATGDLAPADRRLYAIRDVTATVESVDLITASILSKKLAAGLDRLVLDVKCGSGAFMKTPDQARGLALALTQAANGAGCNTRALITDMSQPLVPSMGNALEVAEVMRVLGGTQRGALYDLTLALGEALLGDRTAVGRAIDSGAAMERFAQMVQALGGPADFDRAWQGHLPMAPVVCDLRAERDGRIVAMDGEALGLAVVALGGGRQTESDVIDPSVGLSDLCPLGTALRPGDRIARIHARTPVDAEAAKARVLGAITFGDGAPISAQLILETL